MDDEFKHLRWQCRRGMKEVDVILNPYFDEFFAALSAQKKRVFEELLACHDVDLFEWFMRRSQSDNSEIQGLVDEILSSLGGQ